MPDTKTLNLVLCLAFLHVRGLLHNVWLISVPTRRFAAAATLSHSVT